jgi:ribosomal protein S18 acetylase RimI-like enzyme
MDEISLRPADEQDLDFLWWLHRATLRDYVEQTWSWEDASQEERFRLKFEPEGVQIVLHRGTLIGCLSVAVERARLFLRLIEIAPEYQRRGIGAHLIRQLCDQADAANLPLELHVLKVNPAKRLYERLGLAIIGETDTHYLMRRPAADRP